MADGITRREAIGALAVATAAARPAAAAPAMDAEIIKRHDDSVEKLLARQVTDKASPDCGGYRDDTSLPSVGSAAGIVEAFTTAVLQPLSRHYRSTVLPQRITLAAQYLERAQSPEGFIDLVTTNFNSPPDTGFVVHPVATAACLARRAQRDDVVRALAPFLRKAAAGMAAGGIHTPNHRWVVCSALAQVNEVFPDPAYVRRIDEWLAEGVDLDADGQFTERSTTIYNAVSDRAFIVMAAKLNRPQLLEPARRNLEAMLYLLHANGEVVTEISRRQDRGQRGDMSRYWFPLRYLAAHDKDGRFAALADQVTPKAASLAALMEYPELAEPGPAHAPLPDDFVKECDGYVRFRRGALSATIVSGDSLFFALRRGDAVLNGVRFASAFFGKGQFVGARIEKVGSSYVLRQKLEGPYYQPLPHPVRPEQWGAARAERRMTQVAALEQQVTITEAEGGFRVRFQASGTRGVPLAIEISVRDGVRIEGATPLLPASAFAELSAGADRMRIGPGLTEHRYVEVRGAEARLPGTSIYVTGFTPFDHTLHMY